MLSLKEIENELSRGKNCAQIVLKGCNIHSKESDSLEACGACFGKGMLCGGTCGAVTGALMAIGNYACKDGFLNRNAKEKVKEFYLRFYEEYDSLLCKELLGFDINDPCGSANKGIPTICPDIIAYTLAILDEILI